MSRQTLRMIAAVVIAIGLALPFTTPEIAGIATWKIVLGVVGLALFIAGSRKDSEPRNEGGAN
ncbi:MAG: hypothetical protein FJW27_18430 [Acidimicrobiia bacterium]|nr:hypothetical protein [Acidimicrobiia bacterium]